MGEVINISSVSIYILGLVTVFCFLWGAFLFYKKAVESHLEEEMIFDSVVLSAFWAFIVGRASFVLTHLPSFWGHPMRVFLLVNFPGVERWGVVGGLALGLGLMIRKKKGKYLDIYDLATLGYTGATAFFWVGINFIRFYWQNLALALLNFVFFVVFWRVEKTYRLFVWYRGSKSSAKSGLVTGFGLSALAVSFLVEKIIFGFFDFGVGLWVVLLFITGLVIVYIRSSRLLTDDIKFLKLWNKKVTK